MATWLPADRQVPRAKHRFALAVAAIPEGLPIFATITLARGMWRMLRRNAFISRLSAVEYPGATSILLTDKTGTLTGNRMRVSNVALGDCDIIVHGAINGTGDCVRSCAERQCSKLFDHYISLGGV